MALSSKNGWGMVSNFMPVTKTGPNAVLQNVGSAIAIQQSPAPVRLAKLGWRVDLAPDVPAGTVNVPTRWRLLVIAANLPQDISAFQQQAYPLGAHPEIPSQIGQGAPAPILWDEWFDFAAGDPGLNAMAERDFADSGPGIAEGQFLSIMLIPIIDANLPNALAGIANAQVTLAAFGIGVASDVIQGAGFGGGSNEASLPRFDVRAPRSR